MSVVMGPHGGPCRGSEPVAGERPAVGLAARHRLLRQRGAQPAVRPTDRGPCFVGAAGGDRRAVPGRLTLWRWGLGIDHRVRPPGKPWRTGAVERCQGAVAPSWAGEPDGLAALRAVWHHGTAAATSARSDGNRAGGDRQRVWDGLARGRVARSVDAQGTLSGWDRPRRVGRRLARRPVVVTFDADRRLAIGRDKHERLLAERGLPWLTATWLWAGIDEADQAVEHDGTSPFR